MKTIKYCNFPQKVKSFIQDYFKVDESNLTSLYISPENRPKEYPNFICAEFIPPSKIAYYNDEINWSGIIHDTTHFLQYRRDKEGFLKDKEIVKEAALTNYGVYKENKWEREAFKAQEEFKKYSFSKISWATKNFSEENPEELKNTIWVRQIPKYGRNVPEYWYIQSINDDLSVNGLFNEDLDRLKIEALYKNRLERYYLNIPYQNEEFSFVQNWYPSDVKLGRKTDVRKLSWKPPPQHSDLTGWLVKAIHKRSNKEYYGIVINTKTYFDGNTGLLAVWRDTEKEALLFNPLIRPISPNTSVIISDVYYEFIPLEDLSKASKLSWKDYDISKLKGYLIKATSKTDLDYSIYMVVRDDWSDLERNKGIYEVTGVVKLNKEEAISHKDYKWVSNVISSKDYYIEVLDFIGFEKESKLSWKEIPENLTGWLVEATYKKDKTKSYGIVLKTNINGNIYLYNAFWFRNEEDVFDFRKFPYIHYKPHNKNDFLYKIEPMRYIGLENTPLLQELPYVKTADFNSYKDQNKSMYRNRLNYYNEDEGANIFWSSKDAQEKRFKALTDIGNLEDTEILDVGCGYADFLDYLNREKIRVRKYTGVDIVPEIVKKARELHPDTNIEVRDIQEEPIKENSFDYVFGSGIFALQDQNWQQYVVNMLKEMLKIARKGVAVNFLKQPHMDRLSWQIHEDFTRGWLIKEIKYDYRFVKPQYGIILLAGKEGKYKDQILVRYLGPDLNDLNSSHYISNWRDKGDFELISYMGLDNYEKFFKQPNMNRLSWLLLKDKYPQIYKWLDTKSNPYLRDDVLYEMMTYFEVDESTAQEIYDDWFSPIKEKLLKRLSWKEPRQGIHKLVYKFLDKLDKHSDTLIFEDEAVSKILKVFDDLDEETVRNIYDDWRYDIDSVVKMINLNKEANTNQLMQVDPNFTLNFIRNFVTDKVVLKQGYLQDDFSIFLYKE